MKILLINPPNSGKSIPEEAYGIRNIKMIFRGEPLSLEVIAGNLNGHEVCIADLKADPNALWDCYAALQPDLVGLTGVTCEANAVLQIAADVKRRSDPVVVVGGHHASCDPEYFNRAEINYIVTGLGKLSFRELVNTLERGETGGDIAGVAKTDPGRLLSFRPRRYTTADLVDDAAPRYDLVERYRDTYVMSGVGGKAGFVATAFGCTHRCLFCSIPNMTGGRYLSHGIEAVLRDMRLLTDVPLIRLVDANTFGDVKLAEMLGHRIIAADLKKQIVADVRADTVVRHPELFRIWRQAGLAAAVIGFEEISDERLAQLNKRTEVATNVAAMAILKDLGIRIIGDFIIAPDYAEADFDRLERFVETHDIDLPLPAILTPIPGTPLYKKWQAQITIHDLEYYTFTNAVIPTRMAEKEFYKAYSALLEKFIGHLKH
ncbi:MAG: B12-binding domain-containing radical SAM protein [Desulfobacterales bacterium]|nr:B12-binding domain-containing radical SAM protein [Desulfobacterales bacterium]